MKVGYLGPSGSFSESAAKKLFAHSDSSFVLYTSLDEVEKAFYAKEIDTMVIPFFNSIAGQLNSGPGKETFIETLCKAKHANPALTICAETFVELNFCLLAKTPLDLHEVDTVHVNPYGENLGKPFLSQYPNWKVCTHPSSSAAAQALLQGNDRSVSLSSKQAAEQYGLVMLKENILEGKDVPIMHFLAVSTLEPAVLTSYCADTTPKVASYLYQGRDITSIVTALSKESCLVNIYAVNPNTYYLETSAVWSLAKDYGCLSLGVFSASVHRSHYQGNMQTALWRQLVK